MANEFRLPDIGEGLTDVEVLSWLVKVGQPVARDEPLVEVETDKAVVEIPSPFAGIVLHQGAAAGDRLAVGEILAVVGEAGESWTPAEDVPVAVDEPLPIVGTLPDTNVAGPSALPAVRKLAKDLGIELGDVTGSGPGGRITIEDVEAAAAGSASPSERVPMSATRRAISANLERSWREIPHVTTFGSAPAARLLEVRRDLLAQAEGPMPLEALLIKLVVPLLEKFPEFNAAVSGTDLILKQAYNIAVAVDAPDGLITPVVHDAGALSLDEVADLVIRLAKSARGRKLEIEQLRNATFTISNIGAVGGTTGTPIVPYGTTAIASFGRADLQAVVNESGGVEAAMMLPISMSYDHRAIDGARGRAFMAGLIEAIAAAEVDR